MIPYLIAAGIGLYTFPELIKSYKNSRILSSNTFKVIGTDNSLFYIDDNLSTLIEVENEYDYYDLRHTDIVMDIGACIGGFSLGISDNVKQVYSIEPVMTDSLEKNINLNNKKNITVINATLGNGLTKSSWNGKTEYKIGLTLTELINISGGHIDFLKMDCEGGEWCITPEELSNSGIRRIEAEIHNFDLNGNHYNTYNYENMLLDSGFEYSKNYTNRNQMIIHANRV